MRRAVSRRSHGKIGDCEKSIKRGISGLFGIAFPPSPILRSLYQWRVFKKAKSGRIRGRNKVTRKFIVELLDDIRKTDWTRIENPGLRFLRTAATLACEQQTLFFYRRPEMPRLFAGYRDTCVVL